MNQVIDWFLSEIADTPGKAVTQETLKTTGGLSYAFARIADLLACDIEQVEDILLNALDEPGNMARLIQAQADRVRGLCPTYTVTLTGLDGDPLVLHISPRPVLDWKGRLTGYTATLFRPAADSHPGAAAMHLPTLKAGRMGFWDLYPDTGRMVMDSAFKSLLGYADGDIEDSLEEFGKLVHNQDWDSLSASLDSFLQSPEGVFEVELRMLHKKGRIVWTIFRGSVLPHAQGGVDRMGGTCVDITERVAAEQAIEQERVRLYNLLDRLPAYVCLLDQNHVIRFANRYFRDHFGPADGRTCHHFLHDCKTPEGNCPTFDVFETRSLAVWEWENTSGNRIFRVFDYPFEDLDGSPLVLELGIDITQLRQALKALSASEERYRSITDNLPLGLAVVDEQLSLTATNPTFNDWFLTSARDSGTLCSAILCGRTHSERECPCRRAFGTGKVVESAMAIKLPASPSSQLRGMRHFQMTHCPIRGQSNAVETVLIMVEDVTDKERMQDWLAKVHRLEALSAMAAGVAHEINQPLSALQLYASGLEMLLEKSEHVDAETIQTRLGWIVSETTRIDRIITNMRTLVREEKTADTGPVSLNEAVNQVLSVLGARMENHSIRLKTSFDPLLPLARANSVQLEQVVMNLAVNAIQALDSLDDSGHLSKEIRISTYLDADAPCLSVEDNGPGFSGVEDQIFDPFFTTKESHESMGLGLALAHTFVSNWGGEINASTGKDGGAVFVVRLLQEERESE